MAQNDVFELRVNYVMNSQKMVNVHHFVNDSAAGTGDEPSALADVFNNDFVPVLTTALTDSITVASISARGVGAAQTQYVEVDASSPGAIASQPLPTNIAGVISMYTGGILPRDRGRVYIPGLPEAGQDRGVVSVATYSNLNDYAFLFNDDHTDAATGYVFHMVVWSPAFPAVRQVQLAVPQSILKSMHSRTIGVGV